MNIPQIPFPEGFVIGDTDECVLVDKNDPFDSAPVAL